MKKLTLCFTLMFTLIISNFAFAEAVSTDIQLNERGQIMIDTINLLEEEGFITDKNAKEAKKEFVFNNESLKKIQEELKEVENISKTNDSSFTLSEYLTLVNVLKTLAVVAFLIAFRGVLLKFIVFFTEIPVIIYQAVLLAISLFLTFNPESIFNSHADYLSMFGVVANIMVLGWIVATYEEFFEKLFKIFSLNIPVSIILPFYLSLYFGLFAVMIESQFLGILSVISFVAMFSFVFITTGLTTIIGFNKEDFILPSILINSAILTAYSAIELNGVNIPYVEFFSVGIEYIVSLCLVVALIITSSPFNKEEEGFGFGFFMMIVAFVCGLLGAFVFNMTVIPAFLNTAFFLFAAGWITYLVSSLGGIMIAFTLGAILYGGAMLMESYPELFVTALF